MSPSMEDFHSRKRPRPVVSCLRCREKKLKCDRLSPCENCVKTGTPNDCVYNQYPATVEGGLPKAKRIQPSASINTTPSSAVGPPSASADGMDPPPSALFHRNGSSSGAITAATPAVAQQQVGIVEDLQARVSKLEDLLAVVRPSAASLAQINDSFGGGHMYGSPRSNATVQSVSSPNLLGTLVVKGSRSRYHGQNDRVTLLNQFAEAKEFINQIANDTGIVGLAREVQFLQGKSQAHAQSPEPSADAEHSPALLKLREFLPPRDVCDKLLDIYVKNFEKTLRILHVPSILRQYAEFWTTPDPDLCKSSPFLPQLTAILTLSLAVEDHNAKFGDASVRSYLKLAALDLVAAWLEELGRKQRTELSTLQVETLLLLARQVRSMAVEKMWSATGALVRSAMVMGLHLNPAEPSKLTVCQTEMRRRLWITIVEMDLQASIASGMPSMAPEVDFGPLTPANLNDMDFDENTKELPPSKPLHEWTDSLAQVTLAMSLPQRIKIMTLVKTASSDMELSQVVKQGRRLEDFLRSVPGPLKLENALDTLNGPAHLLNRVLLDIYTRRPLLCLYRPLLLGESRDELAFLEIQRVCLESSLVILSYQDYFDPYVADLDVFHSNSYWDIFQIFCKNDILWAALNVCQYMKSPTQVTTTTASSTVATPPDPSPLQTPHPNNSQPHRLPYPSPARSTLPSASSSLPYSKAGLTRIVENTLDGLIRRIGESGSDLKDVLFLSVVLQSVRAPRGSGQLRDSLMYHGARKALASCRQQLLPAVATNGDGSGSMGMGGLDGMMPGRKLSVAMVDVPQFKHSHRASMSSTPETSQMTPKSAGPHAQTPQMQHQPSQQAMTVNGLQSPPEFLAQSAALANEFNNFQGDIFSFGNETFNIDNNWNFDQFWQ